MERKAVLTVSLDLLLLLAIHSTDYGYVEPSHACDAPI